MGLTKEDDLAGFINLHMIEGLRTVLQFKTGSFSFEELPEAFFDRPSFKPADLIQIYKEVVIGSEELPFLQKNISSAIQLTDVKNLSILPSGPLPPKPAEILGSNRMSFLLSFLKRRYDIIIIDTPPILPATDALLLASQIDGVVLLVKAGATDRKMVKKVVEQIKNSQANLIGIVLNQVNIEKEGYYKYYNKYYSKYYGENP
jgi:capsular exopolysaccharide synthesis family protein